MSNYKISMIIPTFNIGTELKRPINSLLNQTIGFENIEIILVDDYSTDHTRDIILDYAKKYENIKYIFLESNSGSAGKPRNIGIKHASSEYIMFLDNDDEYVDEACEISYDKIKKTDANIIISSKVNRLNSPDDKPSKIRESPEFKKINVITHPEFLYSPFNEYSGAMWSKIFRKEFLLKNNIKCLEKLPEDVYFMHSCYYLNPNILFLTNLNLYNHYFYRTTGQSISVILSSSFLHNAFLSYYKLRDLNKKFNNSTNFFNAYNCLFFEVMAYNIIATNSSNNQKLSLIEEYVKAKPNTSLKFNNKILYSWYKLVCTKQMKLSLYYANFLKLMIKLKTKLN